MARGGPGLRPRRAFAARAGGPLQGHRAGGDRRRRSRRTHDTAADVDQGRCPTLEHRAGDHLPPGAHPGGPGYGGQRPDHRCSATSARAPAQAWRSPATRPPVTPACGDYLPDAQGETSWRASATPCRYPRWRIPTRRPDELLAIVWTGLRSTTGTCATSRFTVERRKLWMLPDPRRQTHRRSCVPDRHCGSWTRASSTWTRPSRRVRGRSWDSWMFRPLVHQRAGTGRHRHGCVARRTGRRRGRVRLAQRSGGSG